LAKKKEDCAAVLAKINKKYGSGTIGIASESKGLCIDRLPVDIFAADYVMGGGLPIGRITGFCGHKSSGKTLMALKSVAAGQRFCREHRVRMVATDKKKYKCMSCGYLGDTEGELCPSCTQVFTKAQLKVRDNSDRMLVWANDYELVCPKCKVYNPFKSLWVDSEGSWENSWAVRQGINCSLVQYCRTEFAEQAIDITDNLLRTGEFDLCVVDSLAHLIPMKEIEASSEDWQQGLQARLLNKFMRKLLALINAPGLNVDQRPTIILINQIRLKIGVMFGSNETKPGGLGQDFATSMDLKFWASKYEKTGEKEDDAGATLSVLVNLKSEKNKTSTSQQHGSFRLWLVNEDGHVPGDTEEFGVVCGLAKDNGLFGSSKDGWCLQGTPYKTLKEVISVMRNDQSVFHSIRDTLLQLRLGTVASDSKSMNVSLLDDSPAEDNSNDAD